MNDITEMAAQEQKSQSGTQDELIALRKYTSDLQEENLSLKQEMGALTTERNNMKADFDEYKSKCSVRTYNANATREDGDIQRSREDLTGEERAVKVILDELLSIQKTNLLMTQERDDFISQYEELEVNFRTSITENNTLKHNLDVIEEELETLQRERNKLLHTKRELEEKLEEKLEELSRMQKDCLILSQENYNLRSERDDFGSQYEELEVNFRTSITENNTLKHNLDVIEEELETLQRERNKLLHTKRELEEKLEELSRMQKDCLMLSQENYNLRSERDDFRSQYEELKDHFRKSVTENVTMKHNLNVIEEELDTVQRDRNNLLHTKRELEEKLEELSRMQKDCLMLSQENYNLRSEHEGMKVNYEELVRECGALKNHLNAIQTKCEALQKTKDALLSLGAKVKKMVDEAPSEQKSTVTPKVDPLKAQVRGYKEQKVKFCKVEPNMVC
jgi:chromosome segregation ATPase